MRDVSRDVFCLLPLRDIVVFPGMIAPLFVGREKSIQALDHAVKNSDRILLLTQKSSVDDDPNFGDLYDVGVVANILQLLKLPDGTVKVLIEGQEKVKVEEFLDGGKFFAAKVGVLDDICSNEDDIRVLKKSANNQFANYVRANKKISPEVASAIAAIDDEFQLADSIAAHLPLEVKDKQLLLEMVDVNQRLEKIVAHISSEIEVLDAEKKIRKRVKMQMEKTQKEYYLNEQLKAIHKELGEEEKGKDDLDDLEKKIKAIKLPKEAVAKATSELKKLRMMPAMSAEATVIRNYLDWIIELPWGKGSRLKSDLGNAQKVLDADHYGLEKVKERILEYLSVQKRVKKPKGPVLCFVGPPGVGKTSLARSIARAVGRKYVKISLGGVRDESEIRGHRRTYVGALPGKIIQSLRKAKVSNPVVLLDEIDKMGLDFRGDPASALLEVLDPEQNKMFNDHYLELDYDLSDIMFIATANTLNIPPALRDRLEIIRISGYTEEEKIEIAKRHLMKKLAADHGLREGEWSVSEGAMRDVIRFYTREAGVRNMERELANLARKSVRKIISDETVKKVAITHKNLRKFSGVERFIFGETSDNDLVGIVNGLAYTESGGDVLTIEAVQLPGKGNVKTTGKLGEVMQESAQAAFSYAKCKSLSYGVIPPKYQKKDLHIHVPEGATPKDGPSAGIAMFTAIVSVMTSIPIDKTVAMTGEITLRGRVLAIGGLKEKLLAALRAGIKTVLIPQENKKDLSEMPENVKKKLKVIPVATADEVLAIALTGKLEPVDWQEAESFTSPEKGDSDESPTAGTFVN